MVWLRRCFSFFSQNAKNLGRSDNAKQSKKKEDGLTAKKIFKKTDTIKKSYKDMEQQALKGVHENETLVSHHPSCKSSWYTLIRDAAVH